MIGRALNGEIECEFKAMLARGGNEFQEIFKGTEFLVDRVVSAIGSADRIGAARF